jgi:hypothetical protein
MISKIISRAACLRELASNPKSFSNCPDLHGGVPGLSRDRICKKPALVKKGRPAYDRCMKRISDFRFRPVADCRLSGNFFFRPERNTPNSYSSYKTRERE